MKRVTLIVGPADYLERVQALLDLAVRDGRAPLILPHPTESPQGLAIQEENLRALWRTLPATVDVWLLERPEHVEDPLARMIHRIAVLERGPRLARSGPWDQWREAFTGVGFEETWRNLVDVPPEQERIPGIEAKPPVRRTS